MTFDPDWPHGHVTRDNRNVRIICKNARGDDYPIIALIDSGQNDECWAFNYRGRCNNGNRNYDLTNAPAPKRKFECWVNVYKNGSFGHPWRNREIADCESSKDRIACKHIIVEEGEGMEPKDSDPR